MGHYITYITESPEEMIQLVRELEQTGAFMSNYLRTIDCYRDREDDAIVHYDVINGGYFMASNRVTMDRHDSRFVDLQTFRSLYLTDGSMVVKYVKKHRLS